ncbi:MAG: CocE/NonD family hydrolase [Ginsengibacter sp.]
MRKIILLTLLASSLHSFAQKIPFPKEGNTDSATLSLNMKVLATQVLTFYKKEDPVTYFNKVFAYQMSAEKYKEALSSLDSLRQLLGYPAMKEIKVIGFQFETFADAKIRQEQKNIPFKEAYSISLLSLYNALSPEAKGEAKFKFNRNTEKLKVKLFDLLNAQDGKDSINLEDAKNLTSLYITYVANSQWSPLALPFFNEQENLEFKKDFIFEDSVLIPTRDGSVIAAKIVRKRNVVVKQPTVLMFNIYADPGDKSLAKLSATKGYVGVVANTRGKWLSPQEIEPFEHDTNDAYDVIDWISKQSWSNGKVGMYGGSYLGFSQWAAAKKVHPALKTIIPQVAVGIGIDYPMQNNVFMNYMLQWIHNVTNNKLTDNADFNNSKNWDRTNLEYFKTGRAFNSLDTIEGRPNKIFHRWLAHPSYDAYWQNMVPYKENFSQINIPILTTTGYYDDDQLGAMYYYEQHHLYNKNANHYLLIGPYDHYGAQGFPAAILNGYTIDSVANINIKNLAFKWFDYILKDSSKPAILKDKVNYQVMGTNEWKHAPSLSKMNNDTLNLYFSNVRVAANYKLATKPDATEFIRQEVDFKDRTDTTQPWGEAVMIDSNLNVSNSIAFVSQTFDKPFDINGAFTGNIMASINKKDMDLIIALYELRADGTYFTLSNFMGRASYAKDKSKRQLLQPGKIENIPYNRSLFVSSRISAGSKLVVVLGVNINQYWEINYGTGKDVSTETIEDAKFPLEIKWYGNSNIKIPVYKY